MEREEWTVNTDGGCRDNPGSGAWAFVITKGNGEVEEFAGFLPHCTNNQAEYRALEAACFMLAQKPHMDLPDAIRFLSDSQLVVNQINGLWRVNGEIYPYYQAADWVFKGLKAIVPISLTWIRREFNSGPDAACNRVMDKHGIVCSKKGKPRSKEVFV